MSAAELVALLNMLSALVRDLDAVSVVVERHLHNRTNRAKDDAVVATLPV